MDIAALGLKVDGVDNIEKASDSLGRFTKSAGDAEKGASGVGSETKKTSAALVDLIKNGNASERALSSIAGAAKTAAAQFIAVTAAAVGINEAAKTLAGFGKSVSAVQAVTRAGVKDMAAMRDMAKQLGAATEFSASQAADGFVYLGLAGWDAQQSIAAIPAVVDLATAASMGLAEAADTASNIMSAFGIAAENAAQVTDVLAAASSRANTDVSQLGEGIKYVGPVAAAMGISVGDAAAAMGVLADAGIQASMGGTGLRRVISSLANPTKEAERTLKSMGLSMDELNPKTNSLEDIVTRLADSGLSAAEALTIFGDRGGPAILALTDGVPKLRELSATLRDVDGESKRMADTMRDNLAGDFLGFKSALEGVVISLGDAGLTAVLRSSTQAATELLRSMSDLIDFVGENLPAVSAAMAVAFGPKIFAAAAAGVKALASAFAALRVAVVAALAVNPVTAIISAIGGFAVYLYSIRDEVSAVGAAFDVLADEVSSAIGAIKKVAVSAWEAISSGFNALASLFGEKTGDIKLSWHGAIYDILSYLDFWINVTVSSLNVVYEAFKTSFHNIGAEIANAFIDAASLITGFVDGASGLLKSLGVDVQTNLTGWVQGGKKEIVNFSEAVKKAWKDTEVSSLAAAYQTKFVTRELERAGEAAWGYSDGIVEAFWGVEEESKKPTRALEDVKKKLTEAEKAAKKFAEEREKAFQSQAEGISKLQEERRLLEDQIATFGRGKRALEQLGIERLKEQAAVLAGFEGSERAIDLLQQEIEEREKLLQAGFTLDALESGKKAAEELAQEVKRTHDDISKSLTDALLRGFESGKGFGQNFIDTLKNMFNTLILRPIIEPVMQGVAGAVTGALGLGGGQQGGASAVGLLGGINNAWSAFSGGLTGTLATGIGKLGATFGSEALKNFAFGLSGVQGPVAQGAAGAVGAGSAVGSALPWVAGGLAAYSLISSLTNKGETRHGGGFVYDPSSGATNFAGGPSGGYGGQATTNAVGDLFKATSDTITGVLEAAGVNAQLNFFHGAFESSSKGRGGTFSGGDLVLSDGTLVGFGGAKKGQGFGGTSGSTEEMFANLQKEVYFSTLEAWQAASGEFPSVVRDMLSELDVRAMTAEQAQNAVQGISEFTLGIRGLIDALDVLPIKNLSGLSFDAAASLAEMSGGIDNLMSSIGGYYEYFYTESERNAIATKNMADQLRSVGVAIPRTRDEFRSLAESLDLGTEAGQRMYATMLNVVDAANDFYSAFESAAQAISSTIGNLYERITLDVLGTDEKRYQYYSDQFESLSKQLAISEDASEIQRLIESMTSIAGSAYGLLDKDAIQGGKGQQYLDMLDDMQALADQRLETAREKALQEQNEQNNQIVASLVHSLNEAGANLSQSAAQVGSAVSSINSRVDGMSDTVSVLSRALMSMRGSEINQ